MKNYLSFQKEKKKKKQKAPKDRDIYLKQNKRAEVRSV